MTKRYDAVVIGGGFFGLSVAQYLRAGLRQKDVVVLEKEADGMQRASYNNQARVHNGYHYPRSLLTALRSRVNFPQFIQDFEPAVEHDFDKYYAVARTFSKVSARQFHLFCERIEADIVKAPTHIKQLFNKDLVEDVFTVKEYAFNARTLKHSLLKQLETIGVDFQTGREVLQVTPHTSGDVLVHLVDGTIMRAKHVFNCTYAMLNKINAASSLPLLALKHELAEMALVKLPKSIEKISVTMMCGPFFSFVPFPDRQLHTLSHVRYTPHSEWHDVGAKVYKDGHAYLDTIQKVSHFPQMIADAIRYMPGLLGTQQHDSLWEIKTVLTQSEGDDSRPILFKPHHGLRNYTCIMGGKLDNIYDAYRELDTLYA